MNVYEFKCSYTDAQRIMNSRYLGTVRLLLDVAPEVFSSGGLM